MVSRCFWLGLVVSTVVSVLWASQVVGGKEGSHPKVKGHLQPFGESGSRLEIEVRTEFPGPADFFINFVERSKPLKLSGVVRDSRAVRQWTDDYLLSLELPQDSFVNLETKKKENRSQETTTMHFHEFLKIYNQTEHYMVDDVPPFLRPDVVVPCSLQCPELLEKGLAFALMWFSSGGTKSVIHTDSFDNINCLFRGEKTFVMVDPARDRDKIQLTSQGAYAEIDVDSVDLTVHPALTEVEFYHVNITAGDCLYIPYRWIHQVRSFGSNVAVNFWWDHYSSLGIMEKQSTCQGHCDPSFTLDQVELRGQDAVLDDFNSIRDWLKEVTLDNPLTLDSIRDLIKREFGSEELSSIADKVVTELFQKLDYNQDGQFTIEDDAQLSEEIWKAVQHDVTVLTVMMDDQERAEREEYATFVEADRKDEL